MTAVPVEEVRVITRVDAQLLAATENQRVLELVRSLDDDDWTKATDCTSWDVRAMVGHLLGGMEGFSSIRQLVHVMRAGAKAAGDGPFVDGMTSVQVHERAEVSRNDLIERLAAAGPASARWRNRVPGLLRRVPMKDEVGGVEETWRMGYLLDVILTRDTWMHRVDIARATGHELVLTPEHDGRIVADVVAEWARRHAAACTLWLAGPAGGLFSAGAGGEHLELDAIEFCRTLSGRVPGTGLLATEVPF